MNELPLEFLARARDKLRYRYPGSGESYIDVVERVRPLITEIERVKCPVIIVVWAVFCPCS
jgi:6-phosphofructo-2-kinase